MARTDTLPHFLTDVADAIRTKGGTSGTIQASSFDTAIANLPSGGSSYAPPYISFYYYNGTSAVPLLTDLDASNLETFKYMFYYCTALTSVDLSPLSVAQPTSVSSMFYSCLSLSTISHLDDLDLTETIDVSNMFTYCSALTTVDLSNVIATKITTYHSMFSNCSGLTSVDISGFTNDNVSGAKIPNMFNGCTSLAFLDISGLTLANGKFSEWTNAFYRVPTSCEIIVKDTSSKQWFKNQFGSSYTNVKTKDEYENE